MENPELRFFLRPSIDIMLEWDLFTMDNFMIERKRPEERCFRRLPDALDLLLMFIQVRVRGNS